MDLTVYVGLALMFKLPLVKSSRASMINFRICCSFLCFVCPAQREKLLLMRCLQISTPAATSVEWSGVRL